MAIPHRDGVALEQLLLRVGTIKNRPQLKTRGTVVLMSITQVINSPKEGNQADVKDMAGRMGNGNSVQD